MDNTAPVINLTTRGGPHQLRAGDVIGVHPKSPIAGGTAIRLQSLKRYGHTPDGTVWVSGYLLRADGTAIEQREIFVQVSHLSLLEAAGRPVNTRPAVPQPRTGSNTGQHARPATRNRGAA